MENEIWKSVKGYEGDYEVSSFGNIRSLNKVIIKSNGQSYTRVSKILKPATDGNGYLRCALSSKGKKLVTKKVHRLVCEAFNKTDDFTLHVNHIDFNRQNNSYKNLEWVTHIENVNHSINNGRFQMIADDKLRKRSINKTIKKGELNGFSKLTKDKVLDIRNSYIPNVVTRKILAEKHGVTVSAIKDVLSRKSWKHI